MSDYATRTTLVSEVENFTEPFTVEWDGYVYEVAKDE